MSCNCHTEITRDGSGQLGRYLKALDPAYAPIDERSIEELLVFIKRYASQIRFYDLPESNPDDTLPAAKRSWREFFSRDMAVIAAGIALTDIAQIKKDFEETLQNLQQDPDAGIYAALYSPIIGMAARIDRWYTLAIPENPLYEDLTLAIQSTLKGQFKKILSYEEGFKLVDPGKTLNFDYSEIKNKALWGLEEPLIADGSIYQGADEAAKIRNAALYVEDIFLSFYGFTQKLVDESSGYLAFALEQYPAHQPHMALFIAFLKLFRLAQEQMNGITERMLNFYYRDVLQLTEKPSVPDRVHIVFELAKDVAEYAVAPGTELSAGKDTSGKEQVYKTETDLVVNQAKVKELKTIFIDKKLQDTTTIINGIYAQPVANSLDGYGEKFTDPYPKWPSLGKRININRNPKNICERIEAVQNQLYNRNEAAIGFAVASPQLVLQGGMRLIAYQLAGLSKIYTSDANEAERKVRIQLTTEKGWLVVDKPMPSKTAQSLPSAGNTVFDVQTAVTYACYHFSGDTLLVLLPPGEAAIVSFDAAVHKDAFDTIYPVMQVLMGPSVQMPEEDFKNIEFRNAALDVWVGSISQTGPNQPAVPHFDGLKTLTLQNDDGALDPSKVFDPFTAYPNRGKSLYIGSSEVFNKTLDALSVNIRLANPVDSVIIGRKAVAAAANDGEYTLTGLASRSWISLVADDNYVTIDDLAQNVLAAESGNKILSRHPIVYDEIYSHKSTKGFLQLEYNRQQTATGDQGIFEVMQQTAQNLKIKEISISYHSKLVRLEAGTDQFFQVYPFGIVEADLGERSSRLQNSTVKDSAKASSTTGSELLNRLSINQDLLVDTKGNLLPQFTYLDPYAKYSAVTVKTATANPKSDYPIVYSGLHTKESSAGKQLTAIDQLMIDASGVRERIEGGANQYSGLLQEEGMLFIGIEKLKPLQTLSLLFQFAEGSAEDEDNDPPAIHWSYLTNNEWRPLKGENIVADDTYGFQTTGIVKIDVPADITSNNTIITNGLHWFCASVTEHANRIPHLVDVVAQAVIAKFEDRQNDQTHFDNALAAGSISKLAVKVAEVSKVIQPFASWDGKHQEIGKEFYTRVSERLRHKGRAINVWDYEHLILDRFPTVYKVKAIPNADPECLCRHTDPTSIYTIAGQDDCCGPQVAPGHVLIVPIANFKNRNALNPLQPKTSRRTLLEIESYIKKRTSPFVRVHAKNPLYEQVLVFFRVKFYLGTDKGYYLKKLNEEIVHFLTPWAFDENADVVFGQKIYASSIINFIEERPYVDFITDFIMGVCKDECCLPGELQEDQSSVTQSPDGRPIITGIVYDSTSGAPQAGVTVQVKGATASTVTDASGAFTLHPGTMESVILTFSFVGYTFKEVSSPVNRSWKIYLLQNVSGDDSGDDEDLIETLSKVCGCDNIEALLQDKSEFRGEVVAKPSTSRSILVSAPRHIIIPYEEKPRLTPCEKLRESKRTPQRSTNEKANIARPAFKPVATVKTTKHTNTDIASASGKQVEKKDVPAKKRSGRPKK
ncbi:carboxypeptidase-like regulatory domain-containing protein [Ohtaekwangia koreensis]|uniref:CarboxypepD_reg-like domain-containing protein n=1 Tax=Ohtaekwangia koreensis TaxID=688867 RepID=A0A1T5KSH1_9BACT|nr:carboxypeptidase-like regulatory domain-containing protein [Ohtaekwangia koreensis]SKC66349.1 CarboxypepD_reg-like domain-containing protein [Ohtaekwangia koreensis]